ncbi:hypothetical protein AB0D66_01430 [Streptomyces sp. NPDC048270]
MFDFPVKRTTPPRHRAAHPARSARRTPPAARPVRAIVDIR